MSGFKNPPAFPCEAQPDRDGIPPEHDYIQNGIYSAKFPGMSLRDWFAGQALAGFMANTKRPTTIAPDDASWCYDIADAMLAERSKGGAA